MPYKHIFFDLDDTLWDSHRNTTETLQEIFGSHKLDATFGFDLHPFVESFHTINYELWDMYSAGMITQKELRESRFPKVFRLLGIPDATPVTTQLQEAYMKACPRKPYLMPHARETLDYLHSKYVLHILTNGFDDVQFIKLESAGIRSYFQEVFTSLRAGAHKPNRIIFDYACQYTQAQTADCLMIGDNLLADIAGAQNAGMDHVFYNHGQMPHSYTPTYEIHSLHELTGIL